MRARGAGGGKGESMEKKREVFSPWSTPKDAWWILTDTRADTLRLRRRCEVTQILPVDGQMDRCNMFPGNGCSITKETVFHMLTMDKTITNENSVGFVWLSHMTNAIVNILYDYGKKPLLWVFTLVVLHRKNISHLWLCRVHAHHR